MRENCGFAFNKAVGYLGLQWLTATGLCELLPPSPYLEG
jgi:hypothetical protein